MCRSVSKCKDLCRITSAVQRMTFGLPCLSLNWRETTVFVFPTDLCDELGRRSALLRSRIDERRPCPEGQPALAREDMDSWNNGTMSMTPHHKRIPIGCNKCVSCSAVRFSSQVRALRSRSAMMRHTPHAPLTGPSSSKQ